MRVTLVYYGSEGRVEYDKELTVESVGEVINLMDELEEGQD